MTEPFGHYFRPDTLREPGGRQRMPQVVNPHAGRQSRLVHHTLEPSERIPRAKVATRFSGEDPIVVDPFLPLGNAGEQLLATMLAQNLDKPRRDIHSPSANPSFGVVDKGPATLLDYGA